MMCAGWMRCKNRYSTCRVVRRADGWLYSAEGLAAIRRALRQPGILAVWSADPSAAFEASLRAADFRVESIGVVARQGAGAPMHNIFLADWVNSPEKQANGETRQEDSPYHRL